jgi:hypothetical protein
MDRFQLKFKILICISEPKSKFNLTSVELAALSLRRETVRIVQPVRNRFLNIVYLVPFHRLNEGGVLVRN